MTRGIRKQKQRLVGNEAPAVKLKMLNGEEKIIGMMAEKVQVMIILPFSDSLSDAVTDIIKKHQDKAFIYIISANALDNVVDEAQSSTDFYHFSFKYGVNVDETLCHKAVFIVNKDGEIVFRDLLNDPKDDFDVSSLDKALDEAIKFKKKGHTHEEWMSV
ncbi:MAG: hypothetical protein K0U38_06545 [Epsilonproteobacteria bacterium]|nr:hypothetical protein [Campylobacterota bacterium]